MTSEDTLPRPNILIAIPTFQSESSLAMTLDSCLAQTIKTDILIVDNASDDSTLEVAKLYKEQNAGIVIKRNDSNLGRVENWNVVLEYFELSDYTHIKYLFPGDELSPRYIEEVSQILSNHPHVASVATRYEFVYKDDRKIVDEGLSGLLSPQDIAQVNLLRGGFLGAIVSNTYAKFAIGKHRFNPYFTSKTDFDFAVTWGNYSYYLPLVLARQNITYRNTYLRALHSTQYYEDSFILSRWLSINSRFYTKEEIAKGKLFILEHLLKGLHRDYSLNILFKALTILLGEVLKKLHSTIRQNIQFRKRMERILTLQAWRT